MAAFSKTSKDRLATCHIDLQTLFNEVVREFDCTIVDGHRSQEIQDRYFDEGKSKVKYPFGKHNSIPSEAVDVAPYISGVGVSWDMKHCLYFAGFVMGVAYKLDILVRYGGDWDMDYEVMTDQSFQDLVHFELVVT